MIPDRYNLNNLLNAVRKPSLIRQEISKQATKSHNSFNKIRMGPGVDVMAEDWDNLLLLDACRYDAFVDRNCIDGQLESRISKGSTSKEFIKENFSGRKLHDTVYITANPYIGHIEDNTFHGLISLLDEWDSELQTVHPSTVVEAAKDAYKTYPEKRFIIHFMQPHQPYIGKKADEINNKIRSETKSRGWGNEIREPNNQVTKLDGVKHLSAPKHSEIDVTTRDVWEAYLETLDLVLGSCKKIISHFDGKTVLSADHGELIGEKPLIFENKTYGHPGHVWTKKLRLVPWFIHEADERRNIKSSPPERNDSIDEDLLSAKLEALGYKQ